MKQFFKVWIFNLMGMFCYAIGLVCFTAPGNIAPGGASGIATLIHYAFHLPIGAVVLVINIPLLLLSVRRFPRDFVVKTVISTVLLSVMTDVGELFLPVYQGQPLLAAMFGGAVMGIGLGLIHIAESNTGGMSLLGLLLRRKNPHWPVGRLITLLNMVVVLASGIVYRNIESVLYASICVYISGVFMDNLVEQASANSLMIIISERADQVRNLILNHRKGVTILKGRGGYTGEAQDIIMSVASSSLCDHIQQEIEAIDPGAFVIISDASRVKGKGFRNVI